MMENFNKSNLKIIYRVFSKEEIIKKLIVKYFSYQTYVLDMRSDLVPLGPPTPPSSESLQPPPAPTSPISISILATRLFDLEWGWCEDAEAGDAGSQ